MDAFDTLRFQILYGCFWVAFSLDALDLKFVFKDIECSMDIVHEYDVPTAHIFQQHHFGHGSGVDR